jgi:hypothetical protein
VHRDPGFRNRTGTDDGTTQNFGISPQLEVPRQWHYVDELAARPRPRTVERHHAAGDAMGVDSVSELLAY